MNNNSSSSSSSLVLFSLAAEHLPLPLPPTLRLHAPLPELSLLSPLPNTAYRLQPAYRCYMFTLHAVPPPPLLFILYLDQQSGASSTKQH